MTMAYEYHISLLRTTPQGTTPGTALHNTVHVYHMGSLLVVSQFAFSIIFTLHSWALETLNKCAFSKADTISFV